MNKQPKYINAFIEIPMQITDENELSPITEYMKIRFEHLSKLPENKPEPFQNYFQQSIQHAMMEIINPYESESDTSDYDSPDEKEVNEDTYDDLDQHPQQKQEFSTQTDPEHELRFFTEEEWNHIPRHKPSHNHTFKCFSKKKHSNKKTSQSKTQKQRIYS
jgi:hypothetical protein